MAKINMAKWSQAIIDAKDVRNLPVLYFPVLKNINMGVIESVKDGKKMAQAMAEVIREYPETIAAITGMDLTADSEAFGAKVKFRDDQAPAVKTHVLDDSSKIASLELPDIHSARINVFFDAVREAKKGITDRPVFGGMFGPFSLAANLLEVSNALMMTVNEQEAMLALLDKCTQWLIQRAKGYRSIYLAHHKEHVISPAEAAFREFCIELFQSLDPTRSTPEKCAQ